MMEVVSPHGSDYYWTTQSDKIDNKTRFNAFKNTHLTPFNGVKNADFNALKRVFLSVLSAWVVSSSPAKLF